ncbi:TM2 domain-containing protein [Williamwhitmania taraxaci]|uniref:TM2 domain-containing protein n=1 Tax=Williamwhitmania taraxaci TaxID=1640674 RepID=A0A1G6KKM2_9BACT|nr:TM2 domain-containing protein [Williamwhitmania taraxaci]SDC31652.1 TM2 domain-containing protein [Williamwhitmania taraxaci]
MKKFLVAFAFLVGTAATSMANTSNYYADNAAVDQVFQNAAEVSLSAYDFNAMKTENNTTTVSSEKNAVVAWALCWVVGGFGIHRHYLGTSGSMWALYTFTGCGIFGIIPTVDWFVLLIDGVVNKNIDKYVDNEKFFMWA